MIKTHLNVTRLLHFVTNKQITLDFTEALNEAQPLFHKVLESL